MKAFECNDIILAQQDAERDKPLPKKTSHHMRREALVKNGVDPRTNATLVFIKLLIKLYM